MHSQLSSAVAARVLLEPFPLVNCVQLTKKHISGMFAICILCPNQADRATEELYNAIVRNDLAAVYSKIEEGADVNFVFGAAYSCQEGYTPLMVACHRCALRPNKLEREAPGHGAMHSLE